MIQKYVIIFNTLKPTHEQKNKKMQRLIINHNFACSKNVHLP